MKKLIPLLAALALVLFAFPALAADASAEVDTTVEAEAPAPEAAEVTCDAETIDFPLTFNLAVEAHMNAGCCYECCSSCDPDTTLIPCDELCVCDCDNAYFGDC